MEVQILEENLQHKGSKSPKKEAHYYKKLYKQWSLKTRRGDLRKRCPRNKETGPQARSKAALELEKGVTEDPDEKKIHLRNPR